MSTDPLRTVRGVGQRENTAGDTARAPRSAHRRRAFSALAVLLAVYGAAGCEGHATLESGAPAEVRDSSYRIVLTDTARGVVCYAHEFYHALSCVHVPDSAPRRREETTR